MVFILQVAKFARDKWEQIGRYLGFKMVELKEYKLKQPDNLYLRLLCLLEDWKEKEDRPRVGALISACEKADIGGKAKRVLKFGKED